MRRAVVALALAVAAVATTPAGAAPARTMKATYQGTLGVAGVGHAMWTLTREDVGEVSFVVLPKESRVEVSVTDATGLPVAFGLYQDVEGNGIPEIWYAEYCGRTPGPVRLRRDSGDLYVFVRAGACGGTAGVPTTGTVTARLA